MLTSVTIRNSYIQIRCNDMCSFNNNDHDDHDDSTVNNWGYNCCYCYWHHYLLIILCVLYDIPFSLSLRYFKCVLQPVCYLFILEFPTTGPTTTGTSGEPEPWFQQLLQCSVCASVIEYLEWQRQLFDIYSFCCFYSLLTKHCTCISDL